MRTSLGEIKLIEQFLDKKLPEETRKLVEKRIQTDSDFQLNVFLQRKIDQLLHRYVEKRMKADLCRYHDALFNDPLKKTYSEKIFSLFKFRP